MYLQFTNETKIYGKEKFLMHNSEWNAPAQHQGGPFIHTASYPTGTRGSFPGAKAAGE